MLVVLLVAGCAAPPSPSPAGTSTTALPCSALAWHDYYATFEVSYAADEARSHPDGSSSTATFRSHAVLTGQFALGRALEDGSVHLRWSGIDGNGEVKDVVISTDPHGHRGEDRVEGSGPLINQRGVALGINVGMDLKACTYALAIMPSLSARRNDDPEGNTAIGPAVVTGQLLPTALRAVRGDRDLPPYTVLPLGSAFPESPDSSFAARDGFVVGLLPKDFYNSPEAGGRAHMRWSLEPLGA